MKEREEANVPENTLMNKRVSSNVQKTLQHDRPELRDLSFNGFLAHFSDSVREEILHLRFYLPILSTLLLDGATESPLKIRMEKAVSTHLFNGSYFKAYELSSMLSDPTRITEFTMEYTVLSLAR